VFFRCVALAGCVTRAFTLVWIVLLFALAGAPARAAPEQPAWYIIVAADGAQLGYASREIVQTAAGREIIQTQRLSLTDEVDAATTITQRTVYTENAAGRIVAIVSTTRTGRERSEVRAVIENGVARIERETAAGCWRGDVVLPPDVRFDDGEALLRAHDPAAPMRLAFDSFNLDAADVEHVVIEAAPHGPALRRRYEGGELRGVSRLTLRDGEVAAIEQPMFGAMIRIVASDRETALRRHRAYRVLPNLMMRSPFVISQAAIEGRIRYRFALAEGVEFPLPQTREQRVTTEPGFATVDICAVCGPGLPADADALAQARRPTPWLQSDHPRLLAIAEPVARMEISDARKMELLLRRARPFLERVDFRGHYSALDTIERRAGDCTEAAVLLAALGRAAGIPTRVASGVSYSRTHYHGVANVFIPHSWTLAFVDGEWRSYDLALDSFDSGHIAVTVGDGDPRSIAAAGQLLSLLRLDGMSEIRPRR
jgi:hypothetical protein